MTMIKPAMKQIPAPKSHQTGAESSHNPTLRAALGFGEVKTYLLLLIVNNNDIFMVSKTYDIKICVCDYVSL